MHEETPAAAARTGLNFRQDADYVHCYYGVQLISSMRRAQLDADKDLWDDWRTLMRLAFDRHAKREKPVGGA